MKLLIDGDIIVYRVGFAAEGRHYEVISPSGEVLYTCKYKSEANDFVRGAEDLEIELRTAPEPLSNVLHSTKLLVNSILNGGDARDYQVYLSGSNNFRKEIYPGYKLNRSDQARPHHYDNIRTYLEEYWEAIITNYIEADDAMGIEQIAYNSEADSWANTMICTIDKDLDMIPGWHYNFVKEKKYFVDEEEALHNYYVQLLTGDDVDNIHGIPQVGTVKAKKILADCKTEEQMKDVCFRTYMDYLNGDEELAWDWMSMNAQLLWILRQEDDVCPILKSTT